MSSGKINSQSFDQQGGAQVAAELAIQQVHHFVVHHQLPLVAGIIAVEV